MAQNQLETASQVIAVVIPSYKVAKSLVGVVRSIGPEVSLIVVVDDACPESSGEHLKGNLDDSRVVVLTNEKNIGVGGATIEGFRYILRNRSDIEYVVKMDGDGQMDASHISSLIQPLFKGRCDYSKGNRFIDFETIQGMPKIRVLGNAVLSVFSKFSSGYWNVLDPNNGFVAITTNSLRRLPLDKIDQRFFFESDMLFRLNMAGAKVLDVPMKAHYGDEVSNLKIYKVLVPFLVGHTKNFLKRVAYRYFLQGMSVASIELFTGTLLLLFGSLFGIKTWIEASGSIAPTGSIVLSSMTIILGMQMLLAFINFDVSSSTNSSYSKELDR